jgi:recombination protein RecA
MALKVYASLRLDVRRIEAIKAGGDVVGNRTRIKVKKNKVAPPFKEAEFDIMYNEGISRLGDILDVAVEYASCTAKSGWARDGRTPRSSWWPTRRLPTTSTTR